MNCTICGKPIELVPSATERAEKYGGNPNDYTVLFTEHAACTIKKRQYFKNITFAQRYSRKADE